MRSGAHSTAAASAAAGGGGGVGFASSHHNNFRSGSVDSQMTDLSGDSQLTTASQTVSNDGIENAIRVGPFNLGDGSNRSFGGSVSGAGSVGGRSRAGSAMMGGGVGGGGSPNRRAAQLGGAGGGLGAGKQGSLLTGTGQVPVCTLCDSASSDFSCRACGGLTFCEKCALSLHTNKFLGSHSLQNILDPNDTVLGSDLAIRRASIDAERAAREIYSDEARQARAAEEEAILQQTLTLATSAGKERAREETEQQKMMERLAAAAGPKIDMKALAADRSVLQARSKELRSCIDILRRLGLRLAEEQASCIDATRSAGDAIKKKFDLLRNLINQKENAFLHVVQEAGKARHEAGASQRTAVAAAVAETTAFVDNLELQLQRLEGNYSQFDECRGGLLEDTKNKISQVDDHIHKFEGVVQEVRDIPLGVVVPVDGIVTALQMLQPPERTIGSAEVAMLNAAEALLPVPATTFENAIGMKHFRSSSGSNQQQQLYQNQRQDSPQRGVSSSTNMMGRSNSNYTTTTTGQQQQQQQQQMRPTPFSIREVQRTSSPSLVNSGRTSPMRNSPMRTSGNATNSPMRISGNYNVSSNNNNNGGGNIPPEVRELRKHLLGNPGSGGGGGGGGYGSKPSTPTRRGFNDSPMRAGSAAAGGGGGGVRTGSPYARQGTGGGGGQVFQQFNIPLGQRSSMASTPPKRVFR